MILYLYKEKEVKNMIYKIKLEPWKISDNFTILKFLMKNDNVVLNSIKNPYIDDITFDFEGSLSEVRAFLQLIGAQTSFKLLSIIEKKSNWFQRLFKK